MNSINEKTLKSWIGQYVLLMSRTNAHACNFSNFKGREIISHPPKKEKKNTWKKMSANIQIKDEEPESSKTWYMSN